MLASAYNGIYDLDQMEVAKRARDEHRRTMTWRYQDCPCQRDRQIHMSAIVEHVALQCDRTWGWSRAEVRFQCLAIDQSARSQGIEAAHQHTTAAWSIPQLANYL
jgi:hypothetical protein